MLACTNYQTIKERDKLKPQLYYRLANKALTVIGSMCRAYRSITGILVRSSCSQASDNTLNQINKSVYSITVKARLQSVFRRNYESDNKTVKHI